MITHAPVMNQRSGLLPELLEFSTPIPGFPDERVFAVSALDPAGVLYALRSTATPGLRFVLADPEVFFADYRPSVAAIDVAALGVLDDERVVLLVIVTVSDGLADATANLLAPIVISTVRGTAMQLVLEDPDLPLRAPLLRTAS